jgi:hypothetical protein
VSLHDHIAELRGLLGQIDAKLEQLDETPAFEALLPFRLEADVFLARYELEQLEALATAAMGARAPALESWRRAVLEHPGNYSKRDQAAAWELTALECERSGNTHGAERARREAGYALGVRGAA